MDVLYVISYTFNHIQATQSFIDRLDVMSGMKDSPFDQSLFLDRLRSFSVCGILCHCQNLEQEFMTMTPKLCDMLVTKKDLRYGFLNDFLNEWIRIAGEQEESLKLNVFNQHTDKL